MQLPLSFIEWLARLGIWKRPAFLAIDVPEGPDENELVDGIILREVRDGYAKWAHFGCPKCREHIRLPLAGNKRWTFESDWLRRPSLHPSIWQTGSCGAHFFVRRGSVVWCSKA